MLAVIICVVFLSVAADVVHGKHVDLTDKVISKRDTTVQCYGEGYTYSATTGHCYKLHKVRKSWDDAQATCVAERGHLVVIDDNEEAEVVKKMVVYPLAFVGLRDYSETHGEWQSVTCKRLDELYNVWTWVTPENYEDQYCAAMFHSNLKLDNIGCNSQFYFICENVPS